MSAVTIQEVGFVASQKPQLEVTRPACGSAQQGSASYSLSPFALAGQRIHLGGEAAELQQAIDLVNRESLRKNIAYALTGHKPLISDLHRDGYISDAAIAELIDCAKSEVADAFGSQLNQLITQAVSKIHSEAMNATLQAYSHIEAVQSHVAAAQAFKLFILGAHGTGHFQLDYERSVALCMGDEDYFAHFYLGLEKFDIEVQRYLFTAIQLVTVRGFGATSQSVIDYQFCDFPSFTTEETFAWISNCVEEIESLPSDESVAHLFDFDDIDEDTPMGLLLNHLNYETALMDGDPDDIDRIDLLNSLVDVLAGMKLVKEYENLSIADVQDINDFLNVPLPEGESELCRFARAVVEVAATTAFRDEALMLTPEDMVLPFGFVISPYESDDEVLKNASQSLYEHAMNAGENFEYYFPDTSKEGWFSEVQRMYQNTFGTSLLMAAIIEASAQKSSQKSEAL